MKKKHYPKFRYFLECYDNQTFLFEDVKLLTYDYRYYECPEYVNSLIKELTTFVKKPNWVVMERVFRESDSEILNREKVIEMIMKMIEALKDPNWDITKYEPLA